MMMNAFTLYRSTLVAAATASLMLVACGRSEDGIMAGVLQNERADAAEQLVPVVNTDLNRDTAPGAPMTAASAA